MTVIGVRIPSEKPLYIALTYLYGVGRRTAIALCMELGLDPQMRAGRLSQDEIASLSRRLDEEHCVEGTLRRSIASDIQRLQGIGSQRGEAHRRSEGHRRPGS